MTIASHAFKQTDYQRLAESEALADCELELLRQALAAGAAISVRVVEQDGDRFSVITVNGQEAVTYMSC